MSSHRNKNITSLSIPAQIDELEAIAMLMKEKAEQVIRNCHKARGLTNGGVSTPASSQQLRMQVIAASKVSRRNARILRK